MMMANSPWVPLSIVKGGQSANFLVKIMESDWGNKLYGKTLIRNIAQAVYKVRRFMRQHCLSCLGGSSTWAARARRG